jgi:hypothetical protein
MNFFSTCRVLSRSNFSLYTLKLACSLLQKSKDYRLTLFGMNQNHRNKKVSCAIQETKHIDVSNYPCLETVPISD